jgi:hypothetical protein
LDLVWARYGLSKFSTFDHLWRLAPPKWLIRIKLRFLCCESDSRCYKSIKVSLGHNPEHWAAIRVSNCGISQLSKTCN